MSWPGRWFHLRASNTEPLLRLSVEAATEQEAAALFRAVREIAQS